MNLDEMIKVGMADLKVGKSPDVLTTLGLGSCVGVAIYDPVTKISGLLHCMLPDSTQFRNNSNKAKYADSGIDELVAQMLKLGASKVRLVANIRLLSEDCGLNYGRTVEFYSETGEYVIKSVGKPRKVI